MSAHLTTRQRNELNAAILDYLSSNSQFSNAYEVFKEEAGLSEAPPATGREQGLLVKKWNSVIRLSKQVSDLKVKMAQMVESDGNPTERGNTGGERRNLPLQKEPVTVMSGHRERVTCVRAHPKFGLVASSSDDSTIKVWDAESGMLEASLKGHSKAVSHIAFNASGDLLASCSSDMTVKLWNMSSTKGRDSLYKCARSMVGHDHTVSTVEFLVAGNRVVSCSRDKTIKIWDISSGYCINTLQGHRDWIRALAVCKHDNLIASGGNDQVLIVWRLSEGTKGTVGSELHRLEHHTHSIQTIAFAGKPLQRVGATNDPSSQENGAAESSKPPSPPEVMLLASAGRDNMICLWNLNSGELAFVLDDHTNWVNDLLFHPTSKYLLSASDDRSVKVFDLESRRCLRTLEDAHGHFVTCLTMAPHLGRLFSGGVDFEVRGWECR
uniref:PAC1-like LisH-like dimerisation domain-containing protein n=2 Tax=Octactis speculum TaxID=3111310 RepID=A0A7S2G0G9_9STRA|mmetsp:Transcript_36073/g.48807  ORF Transcript_36073/g.48807 Transcript_36073/m.48807 type:complete len:438 (+) Transcript_36073:117-1430(+)